MTTVFVGWLLSWRTLLPTRHSSGICRKCSSLDASYCHSTSRVMLSLLMEITALFCYFCCFCSKSGNHKCTCICSHKNTHISGADNNQMLYFNLGYLFTKVSACTCECKCRKSLRSFWSHLIQRKGTSCKLWAEAGMNKFVLACVCVCMSINSQDLNVAAFKFLSFYWRPQKILS